MKRKDHSYSPQTTTAAIIAVCLIIAISSIIAETIYAQRIVTTRRHLKVDTAAIAIPDTAQNVISDTLVSPPDGVIQFCGYEKALRSSKETIFITNLTDSIIAKATFTIDYLDTDNRLIHSRRICQKLNIPPSQTRRYDLPSWDTQKSYYYIHGAKPRKSATPYDVRIKPDTVILTPCDNISIQIP